MAILPYPEEVGKEAKEATEEVELQHYQEVVVVLEEPLMMEMEACLGRAQRACRQAVWVVDQVVEAILIRHRRLQRNEGI